MTTAKQSLPTEVNIGDILRLALPLDTAVIAGDGYARRNVHWVTLLAGWEDLSSQVEADDLVLVPPLVQKQALAQTLIIHLKTLNELNVAGVLFFEPVAEAISAAAGSLKLPDTLGYFHAELILLVPR